mmetsp:Transcript_2534/g.3967  ORF Transcript_2534/g.3967 Transcript_2534/m.3967 type:complete len:82 (+) Transcript_2534:49-294(+)
MSWWLILLILMLSVVAALLAVMRLPTVLMAMDHDEEEVDAIADIVCSFARLMVMVTYVYILCLRGRNPADQSFRLAERGRL